MSRSVQNPYDELRARECEAARNNKKALFILETEWGQGRIDVGQMQRILRGDEPDTCKETR